ncbi:hypothetical protein GW17_00040517 [Ensete ventricosum]|nr:hypothetical protein GW17_00040517 [Ensete ventricosum]
MPMNLKEGDCYVVNHGEDLTTVDFNGYVSLAEKEDVGMVRRRDPARDRRNKMDGAETVVGQRKQGDLDGRKRRSDGYSIKSIRCSIFIALRKKMLTTSKEKVRSYHDRQIKERDHEAIVSKGLSMRFLGLKEFWISWFVDLGRGVEEDGSECYDWLWWEVAIVG